MSWKNLDKEHIRLEFVLLASEESVNMSELCNQFAVSRKTGYKWLKRYKKEGIAGIVERSRRPLNIKNMIKPEIIMETVELRLKHPSWGPKKIKELIRRNRKPEDVPGISSIARILKRLDLAESRGRGRKKSFSVEKETVAPDNPNDIWTVDFKGWWRLKNGEICEPLTIRDLYSRYVLCVKPMKKKNTEAVKEVFRQIFLRYGLPLKIRSDNGAPFASVYGAQGLSRLSAWWRTLGVTHERSRPGHPEDNGSHERFHADMAKEIESDPSFSFETEEKRLEKWRREYNYGRPNEAISMKFPCEVYKRSKRRISEADFCTYPDDFVTVTVKNNGCIPCEEKTVYISTALKGLQVGLEKAGTKNTKIWFCDLLLGVVNMDSFELMRENF